MSILSAALQAGMMAYVAGGSGTTLNPADKNADINLSGGNLTALNTVSENWHVARSTTSKNTGKRYFEGKFIAGAGDGWQIGIALSTNSLTTYLGSQAGSAGWIPGNGGGRQLYANGSYLGSNGAGVTVGGFAGMAVDFSAGKGWVRTSNVAGWFGGGDPELGTTPSFTFTPGATMFAAVAGYYNGSSVEINFGGSAFNMTAPIGYVAWNAASEASFADTFWPQTALLLPFEGVDTATTCADLRGRHTAFTFGNNAQIDTGNSHFPSGALMLDGVSDYILVTDRLTDFVFTGDVTLEVWAEPRAFAQTQSFLSNYAGDGGGIRFGVDAGGTGINMRNGDGAATVSRACTVIANTRAHFAYVRNASGAMGGTAGYARLFYAGAKAGADITVHSGLTLGLSGYTFGIGSLAPVYPNDDEFDGWISYVRVTHAVRYWADFTPPATPFATS